VPPVYAQAFKKGIKGAELAAIPEAGHMVIWEKTNAVMSALERLK
jgi:pimeloyl-ACP methyl ester carboxylesterase